MVRDVPNSFHMLAAKYRAIDPLVKPSSVRSGLDRATDHLEFGRDPPNREVCRTVGNGIDDLSPEADADEERVVPRLAQEPVVVATAVPDPVPLPIERQAGNDHEIDDLGWDGDPHPRLLGA